MVLLSVLLLAIPAFGDDAWSDSALLRTQAETAFAGGDYERAATWYAKALDTLTAAYTKLEGTTASELAFITRWRSKPVEEVAAKIREKTAGLDAFAKQIAPVELGLARCLAHVGRHDDACRALGRALGYDLGLADEVRKDAHLTPIRRHGDYLELQFRIGKGRGHIDTGNPVEYEWGDRENRRRLRLPPGDAALCTMGPVEELVSEIASRLAGAQAPDRLTFAEYDRLCRLGQLRWKTHSGWAYRHSHLFEGGREIEALREECYRRFEERRDERDGPFRALVAFFPALHRGRLKTARELLDYMAERSSLLVEHALVGERWLIEAFLEEGITLPGTTRAECEALRERAEVDYKASDLDVTRLQAWRGYPETMNRLGEFYLLGGHGVEKDAERAAQWFTGAAAGGHTYALLHLAQCYMQGNGVEKDPERGMELAVRAADEGNLDGVNLAGYYYQYGMGAKQDYAAARRLFRKATEAGHRAASDSLGILLHRGLGGDQDFAAAERAYRVSLEAGSPYALRRLGGLALDRRASEGDLETAADFLTRSAKSYPDDWPTTLYLWAVLQLQGKAAMAQKAIDDAAGRLEAGARKEFVKVLAGPRASTTKLLRVVKREKEETARKELTGQAYYLSGILALVKGKHKDARKSFERAVKKGRDIDSLRHSAKAEIRRLDAD